MRIVLGASQRHASALVKECHEILILGKEVLNGSLFSGVGQFKKKLSHLEPSVSIRFAN